MKSTLRKVSLIGLFLVFVSPVQAGPLDLSIVTNEVQKFWGDIKTNSGFKVSSVLPISAFDWINGDWLMGVQVPFANVGSYQYFSGGYSHRIDMEGKGIPSVNYGIRLNDLTRPLIKKGLEKIPYVGDRTKLISAISDSTSIGILAGHDFNLPNKEKIVINRIGILFGYEFGYGSKNSNQDAQTQSVETAMDRWYVR